MKKGFTFPEVMAALAVVATVCTVFVQAVIVRVRAVEELERIVELTSLADERMDAILAGDEKETAGMFGNFRWEASGETIAPIKGLPQIALEKLTIVVKEAEGGKGGEYALSICKRGM